MYTHKTHRTDMPALAAEGAYEGRTMRLDPRDLDAGKRPRKRCGRPGGFPWWALWLIWPLIGLAKWFIPLYLGAAAALLAPLSAAGAAPFVAAALILVGLILILRR